MEDTIFQGKTLQERALLPFGFVKENTQYIYREAIFEDQFLLVVTLSQDKSIKAKVVDADLEEYTAFRVKGMKGKFVGQIRKEVVSVLERIAKECYLPMVLMSEQGQQIVNQLQEQLKDIPTQPFAKFPNIFAFCSPKQGKWYALALSLERGKLDLGEESWSAKEKQELVDVINLKVPPEAVAKLIAIKGIYPSYHMNKRHWVTVVLDGSVPNKSVLELVCQSRNLVEQKAVARRSGPECWVIPANPKLYDIDVAFQQDRFLDWEQKASIQVGDLVAIYMTSPIQAIRYLCQVREPSDSTSKDCMRLELMVQLSDEVLPISHLKEVGVKAVRGPRRLPEMIASQLQAMIEKREQ